VRRKNEKELERRREREDCKEETCERGGNLVKEQGTLRECKKKSAWS